MGIMLNDILPFEQMMVKSPDPVNWTVPLDTGKTFTVTHNIPEGKIVLFISYAHSLLIAFLPPAEFT